MVIALVLVAKTKDLVASTTIVSIQYKAKQACSASSMPVSIIIDLR
ncbi:hypothetical protein MKY08_08590 [Lysinibacillus sp. FSL M8-0337]|nr:hypothetical protein [Lysinibacillus sphaericus]